MSRYRILHNNDSQKLERYTSPTPAGLRVRSIATEYNGVIKDPSGHTVNSTDETINLISKNTELTIVNEENGIIAKSFSAKKDDATAD